ncbi:hypothetical protein A3J43_04415 [Candidatus Uhrbacteria bacterium RIFCSPHIGHO2_12_FULL_54_23]|uniref:Uncharacterized protein n=3 Tax=Candidatus Uhriibacteriota TaxID=1752732 RepID=A0A1F7UJ07_9BACT|nr:MAG: hypothetical protein A3J43_04415 [Candidatus Uhrbacteria bacterium RIFCSPHIGHO2_12_FULL_54_23]OGL83600.1 MAG: hypothetical protein A3B36_02910 [Candidatus Uhrbacteria bacterium RIFCSPLOWO2_01_FULL_55_36]OGL89962.1 MAG: hypothetical protein A3J36_03140 [Candidatus Uhrbacteria bacterium RIFCSPLOWO2_02_FULL_54_37]
MPSLQYFFDPYPPQLISAGNTTALVVLGAGLVLTALLYIVARVMRHDPPRKRFLMRLVQWSATTTFVLLLLYFFRRQRVYLLASPIIALVSCLGLAVWLVRRVKTNLRRMREDEKARQEREMKKKYLN